jgi:hypothetical protein
MINTGDRITIQELIATYNIALDNKNIDEWTNTWTDDGVWTTTFGEAKGKTELHHMMTKLQMNSLVVKDIYQQTL